MTHHSELHSLLSSIWTRRGPQVLVDITEICHETKYQSAIDDTTYARWREKLHELLGVFGIMQFDDCVQLCRAAQITLEEFDSESIDDKSLVSLSKIANELQISVARHLPGI